MGSCRHYFSPLDHPRVGLVEYWAPDHFRSVIEVGMKVMMPRAASRDDHRRPAKLIAGDVDDQIVAHQEGMFFGRVDVLPANFEAVLAVFLKPQCEEVRGNLTGAARKVGERLVQFLPIPSHKPSAHLPCKFYDLGVDSHNCCPCTRPRGESAVRRTIGRTAGALKRGRRKAAFLRRAKAAPEGLLFAGKSLNLSVGVRTRT